MERKLQSGMPGFLHRPAPSTQDRRSKADQVYLLLKNAIVTGEMLPGAAISKHEICEKLGMSRLPVTTAIERLSHERLVLIEPQKGSFVARISLDDVKQWMLARRALESEVASEAALRMPRAALDQLRLNLHYQHAAMEAEDHAGFVDLDGAFHQLLINGLDIPRVEEILGSLRAHLGRIRMMTSPEPGHNESTIAEHQAVFDAIADHDPERAAKAMRQHLDAVLERAVALEREHPNFFASR
jgi:DNA-binding GntR family transcriptional regulator